MKDSFIKIVYIFLKGIAMGTAEVIPGVSGGTIAFISGIYERLLNAIKGIDKCSLKSLFKGNIKEVWQALDGNFLATLAGGMLLGIIVGVFGVGYLLEHFPSPLWAFFFGLILASSIYVGRQITKWNIGVIILIILGFGVAFGVTQITPVEGTINYLWIFFCGFIAISALILPGVSGSFLLLLLGMYTIIRGSAEDFIRNQSMDSLFVLISFVAGCIAGLLTFARLMSYTFKHYRNQTLALLTGFMLGSLYKIWPWQNPLIYVNKLTGKQISAADISLPNDTLKLLVEKNVMPADFIGDPQVNLVLISCISGFVILFVLEYLGNRIAREE